MIIQVYLEDKTAFNIVFYATGDSKLEFKYIELELNFVFDEIYGVVADDVYRWNSDEIDEDFLAKIVKHTDYANEFSLSVK